MKTFGELPEPPPNRFIKEHERPSKPTGPPNMAWKDGGTKPPTPVMREMPRGSAAARLSKLQPTAPVAPYQPSSEMPSSPESVQSRRISPISVGANVGLRLLLGGNVKKYLLKLLEREWIAVYTSPALAIWLHNHGLSDQLISWILGVVGTFVGTKVFHKSMIAKGAPAGSDGLTAPVAN